MTFRQTAIAFILILFVASSCKKSNQFTVSGTVTHAAGDTIFLEAFNLASVSRVDKTIIDKNGRFKLKGETSIPAYYLLKLSETNFIMLLLDSTENVVVEADAANFSQDYSVQGSPGSLQVQLLSETLKKTEAKLDSLKMLKAKFSSNPAYADREEAWMEEIRKTRKEQEEFSKKFVMSNPFSMASVYALYQKYKDETYVVKDLQTMRTAASALNSIYPQSRFVKALYENTLEILKQEKAAKMQQFIQENAENSPEIVLPDHNGKEIALTSLRGKVVLLQFWAAEDRDSRLMNQLLVEAYKKYKNKGFEIYQVNIGTDRSEWIDAIDSDNLSWINVGDLEGSVRATSAYNVQAVPSNYLLTTDGSIAAKNISGPSLDKALAQLLN